VEHSNTQATQLKSTVVTQGQLITHSQSFGGNLSSPEAMVEQVLNSDQAMGS
jgi:hypothetical protein